MKEKCQLADVSPIVIIITCNMNLLNNKIKRQRLSN